jgi:hypothetical protein
MPTPRIFISSTCYDLKYIRENLRYFINTLGYDPILSEEGSVFYDPQLHITDACLAEVPLCQLFILIIGGHFGSKYKDSDKSITNKEYKEAVKAKIPIFALVEREVHEQYRVYDSNKSNPGLDPDQIKYPGVDSTKIFQFIEEVKAQTINNALVPFSDFEEIQNYLRLQWAGMFYHFLTRDSEAKRIGDILTALSRNTDKIEFFTRQVITSVAAPKEKLKVEFYDFIISYEVTHNLVCWNIQPSPQSFLKNQTLNELCGGEIVIEEDREGDISFLTYGGPPYKCSRERYDKISKEYKEIRRALLKKLEENNISLEDFLQES